MQKSLHALLKFQQKVTGGYFLCSPCIYYYTPWAIKTCHCVFYYDCMVFLERLSLFIQQWKQEWLLSTYLMAWWCHNCVTSHVTKFYFLRVSLFLMPSSHRRHRQDKTVPSRWRRRCELSWRQSQTVFSSPQYMGDWTVLSSLVCGVNAFEN